MFAHERPSNRCRDRAGPQAFRAAYHAPGVVSTTDLDEITQAVPAPRDRIATSPMRGATGHLDRYVMLEQVGAGGMGVVHRAYDPKLRREVAIKMLRIDRRMGSDAPRATVRIMREARAMAQLSHANVLPVYDVESVGDQVYIAMEYVDGTTLSRWLRQRTRPWRELIPVFLQAGQGLLAAHQAGIVHRDFKPSNVLMGNNGRVLVTDFGLAQARDDDEPDAVWSSGSPDEGETVTESGEVVGTPAYMAPEQLRGDPLDARADQYAFCTALFEGLYGRRPFPKMSPSRLLIAKEEGRIEPEPAAQVPAWLFRIVQRGLSPEPDERYPTMEPLLQALAHDPAQTRRRWAWVGAGAVLGAAALGLQLAASEDVPCADAESLAEELWGAERRGDVHDALLATGLTYAGDTANLVAERVATYTGAWAAAHVETCEATRVRGEQSAEAFDLRMACLRRHRVELEATLESLSANVSPSTLRRATSLVAELPAVEQCADVEALRDRGRSTDPAVAAEVEELGERLARAKALVRAERTEVARPLIDELERRTEGLDLVLHGEALMLQGTLAQVARDKDTAALFERAYADAVEARHAPLAATTAVVLTEWLGSHEARTTEAELWAAQAEAWLRGRDPEDPLRVRLSMAMGNLYQVAGRLDDARIAYLEAVERLERRSDDTGLVDAHHKLGVSLMALGRADEAARHFDQQLELSRRLLGPQHPYVGRAHRNLGATLYMGGELARALPHLERALAITEATHGSDHPRVAGILGNLGAVRDDLGEHDEARELFERALAIMEATEGTGLTERVSMLGNLASALRHAGDPAAATEHLRRAITLVTETHGTDHPEHVALLTLLGEAQHEAGQLALARETLDEADRLRSRLPPEASLISADAALAFGRLLLEQGEPEPARARLEEAVELYAALGAQLDPRRGETLLELGRARLALGQIDQARVTLEGAISLLAHRQADAAALARARFTLARALRRDDADDRDRDRAESLARDALAGLDEEDPLRPEVLAWLGEVG